MSTETQVVEAPSSRQQQQQKQLPNPPLVKGRPTSSDLAKTGLPRLRTSDVNVRTLLTVQPNNNANNNNDLSSAISSASTVSQIIGGYIYTPLTPADRFEKNEEVVKIVEEPEEEGKEEEESVEDSVKPISRVLSTTSMEVPFALADDFDVPPPLPQAMKRQSGNRRNSKLSTRLSQLRTVDTGTVKPATTGLPIKFEVSESLGDIMVEDSPIDWAPIQRLLPRDPKEPVSAISPMSCITDAFTEETEWPTVPHDTSSLQPAHENHIISQEGDYDCELCTNSTFRRTVTSWDGVTIIEDASVISPVMPRRCVVETISHQDHGKEVVMDLRSPVISCRIDSVVNLDLPEFLPADDDEEEEEEREERKMREARRSRGIHSAAAAPAPPPSSRPKTLLPTTRAVRASLSIRAANDPLSISRQSMRQEWTETPPMKLDMAKLESMAPPRVPTPGTTSNRASPLPWLSASRSASPARSIEKQRKSPDHIKRSRSPRGWKLW